MFSKVTLLLPPVLQKQLQEGQPSSCTDRPPSTANICSQVPRAAQVSAQTCPCPRLEGSPLRPAAPWDSPWLVQSCCRWQSCCCWFRYVKQKRAPLRGCAWPLPHCWPPGHPKLKDPKGEILEGTAIWPLCLGNVCPASANKNDLSTCRALPAKLV